MRVYSWQKLYQEAMLELNDAELRDKLNRAVSELRERGRQLVFAQGEESRKERQAITDALNGLSAIAGEDLPASSEAGLRRPAAPTQKEHL